jgi:hypothetical protein
VSGRAGRRLQGGPLDGHYKVGRSFQPPLMAMPETQLTNWLRDDLPDLIWPVYLIGHGGDTAAVSFGRVQAVLAAKFEALDLPRSEAKLVRLDGRLTSLERVPEATRKVMLSTLEPEIARRALIASPLLALLRLYRDLPGAWLLVDPYRDREIPDEADLLPVASSLRNVATNGHLEALVKFTGMAWDVLTGQLSTTPEVVTLLKDYPGDKTLAAHADTVIRAMFGAREGCERENEPELYDRRVVWAKSFWQQNWALTPCLLGPSEPTFGDPAASASEADQDTAAEDESSETQELVDELVQRLNNFMEEVCQPDFPVDLYSPAKHEVLCGLVARAARSALAVLEAPHLWCGEHAAPLIRLLAETAITMTGVATQDPALYERFQQYGIGKAKLQRRRMSELAAKFDSEPPELLAAALERARNRLGGDWGEEFVTVNLDSTFSGRSVRQMAYDCGLEDLYVHVYQAASSVTHGEWDPIADQIMIFCANSLHRWHRLPATDLAPAHGPDLGSYFVGKFSELCDLAREHLATTDDGMCHQWP